MMAANSLISGFPLETLLSGITDKLHTKGQSVTGIAMDSRKVKPGDLYIACTVGGISNISYIPDAVRAGATAVLVEEAVLPDPNLCRVPLFRAKDLYKKIGVIADRFYEHPSAKMTVVGVTGTNGKTTVSHMLAQCLSKLPDSNCGLIGTLGYGPLDKLVPGLHTTPEALALQSLLADMKEQKLKRVVMEVSSHALDQYRVAGVNFDLAIFTNLSRDHLDYHRTMEEYAISKQRLFNEYGIRRHVINIDDETGENIFRSLPQDVQAVSCTLDTEKYNSIRDVNSVACATITDTRAGGMTLKINSPWGEGHLSTCFIGTFNARNILSVLSALCLLGYSFEEALSRISGCKNIPGRLEVFGNDNTAKVVVDYAHTPDAMEQVLMTLRSVCAGKLYCVFGCGGDRDQGKRPQMAAIAEKYADFITITSDNPRNEEPEKIIQDILSGIHNKQVVVTEPDREIAIRETIARTSVKDIVLIAGKGHENYQEIAGFRQSFSDQEIVKNSLGITA